MVADAWDPAQYARFQAERAQPFTDLMALVRARPGMRVVDLGCGPGELTRVLHCGLEARETIGIDSSEAMLAKARPLAENGLSFEAGDIASFAPTEPFDLVFSNAAIHWIPDHCALLTRLTAALTADGQLAVQVPANHDHPSHLVAEAVATESPFVEALERNPAPRAPVLPPEEYAVLLDRLGYREQHVLLRVYGHHLPSREEVVEWVKGTLLTSYRRRLPEPLYARFLDVYRERLLSQLEDRRPYFFAFKRILFWARR